VSTPIRLRAYTTHARYGAMSRPQLAKRAKADNLQLPNPKIPMTFGNWDLGFGI